LINKFAILHTFKTKKVAHIPEVAVVKKASEKVVVKTSKKNINNIEKIK